MNLVRDTRPVESDLGASLLQVDHGLLAQREVERFLRLGFGARRGRLAGHPHAAAVSHGVDSRHGGAETVQVAAKLVGS